MCVGGLLIYAKIDKILQLWNGGYEQSIPLGRLSMPVGSTAFGTGSGRHCPVVKGARKAVS